ncbi:MAG: hypothetical protein M3155_02765 [Actinomycetota bacterium]|nr:hypothetical protein [Actinomycetota bacterium]
MTAREANVFACLVEAVVEPADPLPPLARTDVIAFLDRYLEAAPPLNRAGLRALLHALEMGPRVRRRGARFRQLPPSQRAKYLERLGRGRASRAFQALEMVAKLAYYGDDGVMRSLGYDADAVVARGRQLRAKELRW